jgi:hypothetical protein
MRFGTSTAAAAGIIAAAITVCGCSSSGTSNPSSGSSTTSSASASPSTTVQATPSATSSSQGSQAASDCTTSDLSFALGAKSGSTQVTQVVDLTNKGSATCTMDGFPGVDLVGLANGQQDYSWSLVRSSASYSTVTLSPGQSAHFDLIYLPKAAGDPSDIDVVKFVITPPNTYTQAEVTWSQDVQLQDGATHPGTYITPVVSGS